MPSPSRSMTKNGITVTVTPRTDGATEDEYNEALSQKYLAAVKAAAESKKAEEPKPNWLQQRKQNLSESGVQIGAAVSGGLQRAGMPESMAGVAGTVAGLPTAAAGAMTPESWGGAAADLAAVAMVPLTGGLSVPMRLLARVSGPMLAGIGGSYISGEDLTTGAVQGALTGAGAGAGTMAEAWRPSARNIMTTDLTGLIKRLPSALRGAAEGEVARGLPVNQAVSAAGRGSAGSNAIQAQYEQGLGTLAQTAPSSLRSRSVEQFLESPSGVPQTPEAVLQGYSQMGRPAYTQGVAKGDQASIDLQKLRRKATSELTPQLGPDFTKLNADKAEGEGVRRMFKGAQPGPDAKPEDTVRSLQKWLATGDNQTKFEKALGPKAQPIYDILNRGAGGPGAGIDPASTLFDRIRESGNTPAMLLELARSTVHRIGQGGYIGNVVPRTPIRRAAPVAGALALPGITGQ